MTLSIITGTTGNDSLTGTTGSNSMHGGAGNDMLNGGKGNDHLWGDDGDDVLNAGDDYNPIGKYDGDFLYGGNGNDTLNGGGGSDGLSGDEGDDVLFGKAGNDFLYGGAGNDTLDGGTGIDILYGGTGKDSLTGGAGTDYFYYRDVRESSGNMDTITDFKPGVDKIVLYEMDASTLTPKFNDTFAFIGGRNFTKAGQVRFDSATHILYLNTNGDLAPDCAIYLPDVVITTGANSLQASDFFL